MYILIHEQCLIQTELFVIFSWDRPLQRFFMYLLTRKFYRNTHTYTTIIYHHFDAADADAANTAK